MFTLGAALVTSLIFGLIPALQATNEHLLRGLQESGRSGGGGRTHRMRAALVVAEMALAVVLLTGAGLVDSQLPRIDERRSWIPAWRRDGAAGLVPGRRISKRRSGSRAASIS